MKNVGAVYDEWRNEKFKAGPIAPPKYKMHKIAAVTCYEEIPSTASPLNYLMDEIAAQENLQDDLATAGIDYEIVLPVGCSKTVLSHPSLSHFTDIDDEGKAYGRVRPEVWELSLFLVAIEYYVTYQIASVFGLEVFLMFVAFLNYAARVVACGGRTPAFVGYSRPLRASVPEWVVPLARFIATALTPISSLILWIAASSRSKESNDSYAWPDKTDKQYVAMTDQEREEQRIRRLPIFVPEAHEKVQARLIRIMKTFPDLKLCLAIENDSVYIISGTMVKNGHAFDVYFVYFGIGFYSSGKGFIDRAKTYVKKFDEKYAFNWN